MTDLPERDLWETYMPAFKALVQQGDVREIMCAYQRNDGEPCCGNTRYLQQILRDEWGFRGLVTSDCGAVSDFWKPGYHEFSPTRPAPTWSVAVCTVSCQKPSVRAGSARKKLTPACAAC